MFGYASNNGVKGFATGAAATGVVGAGPADGAGVYGVAGIYGVIGEATSIGVKGTATSYGVIGAAASYGVYGVGDVGIYCAGTLQYDPPAACISVASLNPANYNGALKISIGAGKVAWFNVSTA